MEVTLFQAIYQSIEKIGLTSTLVALAITITLGWLYRNNKKEKKILTETVDSQNRLILQSMESQNVVLHEVLRSIDNTTATLKELTGKLDGAFAVIVSLVQREFGGDGDNKGGN